MSTKITDGRSFQTLNGNIGNYMKCIYTEEQCHIKKINDFKIRLNVNMKDYFNYPATKFNLESMWDIVARLIVDFERTNPDLTCTDEYGEVRSIVIGYLNKTSQHKDFLDDEDLEVAMSKPTADCNAQDHFVLYTQCIKEQFKNGNEKAFLLISNEKYGNTYRDMIKYKEECGYTKENDMFIKCWYDKSFFAKSNEELGRLLKKDMVFKMYEMNEEWMIELERRKRAENPDDETTYLGRSFKCIENATTEAENKILEEFNTVGFKAVM